MGIRSVDGDNKSELLCKCRLSRGTIDSRDKTNLLLVYHLLFLYELAKVYCLHTAWNGYHIPTQRSHLSHLII